MRRSCEVLSWLCHHPCKRWSNNDSSGLAMDALRGIIHLHTSTPTFTPPTPSEFLSRAHTCPALGEEACRVPTGTCRVSA